MPRLRSSVETPRLRSSIPSLSPNPRPAPSTPFHPAAPQSCPSPFPPYVPLHSVWPTRLVAGVRDAPAGGHTGPAAVSHPGGPAAVGGRLQKQIQAQGTRHCGASGAALRL
eukprot:21894-Chlamydomonas_euryale.AAC.2